MDDNITDDKLINIRNLKNLEHFELNVSSNLTNKFFDNLTNLKILKIKYNKLRYIDSNKINENIFKKLNNLEQLYIDDKVFLIKDINLITHIPKIDSHSFDIVGITDYSKIKELKLSINEKEFFKKGDIFIMNYFNNFLKFENLRKLTIVTKCKLPDNFLKILKKKFKYLTFVLHMFDFYYYDLIEHIEFFNKLEDITLFNKAQIVVNYPADMHISDEELLKLKKYKNGEFNIKYSSFKCYYPFISCIISWTKFDA